jgi:dehydrogenase/reductase SDR family protein 12
MASGGMYTVPRNLRHMAQSDPARFNGTAAYGTHKRAQLVLSDRWTQPDAGLRAYTMHPGWVDTAGVQRSLPLFRKLLGPVLRSPAQGADTALWLLAERPPTQPGALWFDRAPRPAHVFAATRTPRASEDQIVAMMEADAARLSGQLETAENAPA